MNVAADKQYDPENRGHPSCHVAPVSAGWRLRLIRPTGALFVGRVSEAPPGNMLGSEPDFLPEMVIGFPGSQPGKAFLTRDFSVLCAPASWCYGILYVLKRIYP